MKKLIAIAFLLSSCSSYIPFTDDIRKELQNKKVDITKVQFSINDKIVLKRSSLKQNQKLSDGTFQTTSQLTRERIVFPVGTPAICKDTKEDKLGLYFEDGDATNKRLIFKLNPQNTYVFYQQSGSVQYDGQNYEVAEGQGTVLYISKKEITKTKDVSRYVKGLKVN